MDRFDAEWARRQSEREKARTALLSRERVAPARSDLLMFTQHGLPTYQPAPFHVIMAKELEQFLRDVIARQSPRLIFCLPPRHGKSELVSRRFPAFALGNHPDLSIISTSYSSDLSSRFNRDVQRVIDDPTFGELFHGVSLWGKNIRSVAHGTYLRNSEIFEIVSHKGVYRSAGVGQGITGMGADILIVDDPIKDAAEASSPTVRSSIVEWFGSTAYTRLGPGGGVIVCMTRWNENDLVGHLLDQEKEGGEAWKLINFPAIAECDDEMRREGEALDPVRYPLDSLMRIRRAINEWNWASLYQQRPAPREGGMFKRHWFEGKIINAAPAGTVWARHWDLAATAKKTAACTAGVKIGRTSDGRFVVGHVVKTQDEGNAVRKLILATAQMDGHACQISLPQDPGQAGKVQAQDMVAMLAGFRARAEPETGDKSTRAEPFAVQCEAGNVSLVAGEWNNGYLDELCMFPAGKFKDQVDASSGAFAAVVRPFSPQARYGVYGHG